MFAFLCFITQKAALCAAFDWPCGRLFLCLRRCWMLCCVLQTWQRPTLPRLKTEYHWRWGVSRPCSEWERVQPPRNNHQVGKTQQHTLFSRSWVAEPLFVLMHTSYLFCPDAQRAPDGPHHAMRRPLACIRATLKLERGSHTGR